MAKIITINRKYLTLTMSIALIALIGFAGITIWKTAHAAAAKTEVTPEVKMLGVTIEPGAIMKDVAYGSVTFKDAQIIPSKTFDLIATIQNTTAQKMTNVPVELIVTLVEDEKQKISTMGSVPSLEPGESARIAFRKIKAFGDAQGKSSTAGQHLITLRIKPNAAGGVSQTSEAIFKFIVDSTVQSPKNK